MFVGAVLAIKETVKTKRAYDYVGYDYEPYFDYRLPLAPISGKLIEDDEYIYLT